MNIRSILRQTLEHWLFFDVRRVASPWKTRPFVLQYVEECVRRPRSETGELLSYPEAAIGSLRPSAERRFDGRGARQNEFPFVVFHG